MDSPIDAQALVYGPKKGPPMLYDEIEPPSRPTKRRKVELNKRVTDQLLTTIRQQRKMMEKGWLPPDHANNNISPCQLPGGFPEDLSFRALAAYSLLRTLSVQLRLSPFTPNVFLRALYLPFPNKLLGKIHLSLMRILLPQLQLGFSYKAKGGAVGVHKRRHIDNVKWPLRAGDNLTFLDRFTWPLFYDDYCHLTADRLWASFHDEELHMDFRHAELKDVGIEDYVGSDTEEEEEEEMPPVQSWSTSGMRAWSMMQYRPSEPQAPTFLERTERRGRKAREYAEKSDTESEYDSDAGDEDAEVWLPGSKKKKRKRQKQPKAMKPLPTTKKSTKPVQTSTPNQSKSKVPPKAIKPAVPKSASKKLNPPAAAATPAAKKKLKQSPKMTKTTPAGKTSTQKVKTNPSKKTASPSGSSKKPRRSKNRSTLQFKTPKNLVSKVFDVESTVPGMISDSDKLHRSKPIFSLPIVSRRSRKRKIHPKLNNKDRSKVLDVTVAKPFVKSDFIVASLKAKPVVSSAPVVPCAKVAEKSQNTTVKGSGSSTIDEDIIERTKDIKAVEEPLNNDAPASVTKADSNISRDKRPASDGSAQGGANNSVSMMDEKKVESSPGKSSQTGAINHSAETEVESNWSGKQVSDSVPQANRPRGRATMKLPTHSSKYPSPFPHSAKAQYRGPQATNFASQHQLYQQQTMQQQRMLQLQQQQKMAQMQALQQGMNMHQFQIYQMQMQQQQQQQQQQMAMQGGLRGNFSAATMNGNFGYRQQQKSMSSMHSYGGGSVPPGYGMAASMMYPQGKNRTFSHERDPLRSKGKEVSDEIASTLQNFVCGIDSAKVDSQSTECKVEDNEESDDVDLSFEAKLDEHRWAHFEPLKAMRSGVPYYRLPMQQKLVILEFLIDELLQVDFIAREFSQRQARTSYSHPYGVLPSEEEFENLENEDECAICLGEGELLCCDGCIRSYHRQCLDMSPGQQLPDGKWLCAECQLVDPANYGTLRGGRKASLDWFKVDDIELAIKDKEEKKKHQAMISGLLTQGSIHTGIAGTGHILGNRSSAQMQSEGGEIMGHHLPGSNVIVNGNSLATQPASLIASGMTVGNAGQQIGAFPSMAAAVGSVHSLSSGSVPTYSAASNPSNPSAAVGNQSLGVANSGGTIMPTKNQTSITKGMEFIAIHGFVFARKASTVSAAATSIAAANSDEQGTRSQLHLVLKQADVEKYLEGMGSKTSQAWPLVQIPSKDKSPGDNFPSTKVYLNPLASFDPSFYSSKYRKAPVPFFMHAGGGSHLVKLMSADFESECAQLNTYKVTDAMLRDFSFDANVAEVLRTQVSLFDPYQFIKGYVLKLETSLRKSCLINEFWDAGTDKSKRDIWELNLRKSKSVNRLAELLVALVDEVHPRAFSEGWFHNPLLKNVDSSDGSSKGHFVDLPPNWNAKSELTRRKWERTEPDKLLHTATKENCPLDGFVRGIRPDLLEPMEAVRSKRKKPKPAVANLNADQKIGDAAAVKMETATSSSVSGSAVAMATDMSLDTTAIKTYENSGLEGSYGAAIPMATSSLQPEADAASQIVRAIGSETACPPTVEGSLGATIPMNTGGSQPEADRKKVLAIGSETARPFMAEKLLPEGNPSTCLNNAKEIMSSYKVDAEEKGRDDDANAADASKSHGSHNGSSKKGSDEQKEPTIHPGRTRRSGRLTRHAAEASSGPVTVSADAKAATGDLRGIEYLIEKAKESKIKKIEKIVKGPLLRDVMWPIAGRIPFATVGNLSRSEMKRLARNAGVVQATHIAYETSHEVGQVCREHLWRKRTEQCTGLEELLLLIRVLESFVERPTIHSCETLLRRINSRKAHLQKTITCSHRDPATGTLEYFVTCSNRNRERGCWMSYEQVDLITLVAELHRRREIHNSKRLEYLKAQEIVKKARLEKERAEKAAEAKRAAEARKAAERVAKEAARARKEAERVAAAAKAAERTAARKKELERKSEEKKWSKELNRVLTQHQMQTVLQNSACSPEIQAQIRARTISQLRVVAEGLNKCNFPMTEQQLVSLLDSSEKRAMQSMGRPKHNAPAAPSAQSVGGAVGTVSATQPKVMAQTSMAPNAGAWPTQSYHGDPNGANSNSYGAYPPANAMQQHYSHTSASSADQKQGRPQKAHQNSSIMFSSVVGQQPQGTPQANNQGLWQQAPQGNSTAQGGNWDQNAYFGDLTSPSPIAQGHHPNSQSPGGLDANQSFANIFDTPEGPAGRTPETAGNLQFQQHAQGQYPTQQYPSPYGHATGQPPYNYSSRQPAYDPNQQQQQQVDPLLSQFPSSTQQLTPQRQYHQQNQPPPQPAYNYQYNATAPQPQPSAPAPAPAPTTDQNQHGVHQLQQQLQHLQRLQQQQQQYQQQYNQSQQQNFY